MQPTGTPDGNQVPGAVIYCGSLIALALAVGFAVHNLLGVQNVLLVFLPVILFAAVRFGFWTASWVALLSVLATSYFFAEPRYSFAVADRGNVWALAIFLLAAGLTSSVAAQARQRAEAVTYHNRILEQLYVVTSHLSGIARKPVLADAIVQHAEVLLGADIILLERTSVTDSDALSVRARAPAELELSQRELAGALDCTLRALDVEIAADSDSTASWHFHPIKMGQASIAALGIRARNSRPPSSNVAPRLVDLLIEQIELNFERIELAEETQRAEVLRETEKLQTALLTSLSHDLKTPLASILGNVTSLRRYGHLYDEETRLEMLDQAEEEALRLSRFVDNLLHMTRLEAGVLKPTYELIDLSDALGSALTRLERILNKHVVSVHIDEPLPMLMLDFVLTEQVIVNLLDNAAKYSPPGGRIEIAVSRTPETIRMVVQDEGPGIAPDDAERIFERFFRIKTSDRSPAGTGLGLAICKGFVEAMGGTISVGNRITDKGACFSVSFPVEHANSEVS